MDGGLYSFLKTLTVSWRWSCQVLCERRMLERGRLLVMLEEDALQFATSGLMTPPMIDLSHKCLGLAETAATATSDPTDVLASCLGNQVSFLSVLMRSHSDNAATASGRTWGVQRENVGYARTWCHCQTLQQNIEVLCQSPERQLPLSDCKHLEQ